MMDKIIQESALRELTRRLEDKFPAQISQVFLYGSRARGDAEDVSDVDILVIADSNDWRLKHEISNLAADISLEFGLLLDSHVISSDKWQWMGKRNFRYYNNVMAEGVPITPAA